jgi:hypothetical protein
MKLNDDPDHKEGMRYLYTGPNPSSTHPKYVVPLQSFFVAKANNGTSAVTSVSMSPEWTTTAPQDGDSYTLRSATAIETGILRIKAAQGNRTSYALLQYDPSALPAYRDAEDVQSLFFDEIPLTLYSLTARQEPLSISASSDFKSQTTDLGLRILNAGEMKLEFSGLETFGHDVYLIDREKNCEINLQQTPEYTFIANKPTGAGSIELNDRFSLRMDYTGAGLSSDNDEITAPALTVTGSDGWIHLRSTSGDLIRSVQIYNLSGQLIYSTSASDSKLSIPVARSQTYIVKASAGNVDVIEKVIVK